MRNGHLFISSLLLLAFMQSNSYADTTNITNNYYGNSNDQNSSYGPYGSGDDYVAAATTDTEDDYYTTNTVVRGAPVAPIVRRNDAVRAVTPGRVGIRR